MENKKGVKFVRIRGRIVPIREKGASIHKELAVMGVGAGVTGGLAINAAAHGRSKTALGFGAAALGLGGLGMYKDIVNSFEHGNKKKSFWHGVGRTITNGWAQNIGTAVGAAGVTKLAFLAGKSARMRKLKI